MTTSQNNIQFRIERTREHLNFMFRMLQTYGERLSLTADQATRNPNPTGVRASEFLQGDLLSLSNQIQRIAEIEQELADLEAQLAEQNA